MTSSYNLSRRPLSDTYGKKNMEAYVKHFGICQPGYLTTQIAPDGLCSDWKICSPIYNEEGNIPTIPIMKDIIQRQIDHPYSKRITYNLYDKISPNDIKEYEKKYGVKSHPPSFESQSAQNFYPIRSRSIERRALDKADYFQTPLRFNSTGYDTVFSENFLNPTFENVKVPPEWNPFQLIQRNEVQKNFY